MDFLADVTVFLISRWQSIAGNRATQAERGHFVLVYTGVYQCGRKAQQQINLSRTRRNSRRALYHRLLGYCTHEHARLKKQLHNLWIKMRSR